MCMHVSLNINGLMRPFLCSQWPTNFPCTAAETSLAENVAFQVRLYVSWAVVYRDLDEVY
jgi:hypothetical protein